MCRKKALGCLAALLISQSVQAVSYPLPPAGSRLVGSSQVITVPDHNTLPLEAFAAQYGQGLSNMLEANPGVDPFLPKSGTRLVIPQQLILPDTVREGIVVNVAEMRLYYYPPGSNTVEVLPIGIGQAGRETPRNWVTAVERKQVGPTWSPTPKTRRAYAAEGKTLPAFVPAGPDNPMGLYAIYIGRLYAIHGTNSNFGIGLRVSQGCIRLRNNDIKYLFDNVPVGTRVQLIDRPVKVTTEPDGSRWVEVHEPLSRNRAEFESTRKVPLPISAALRTELINEGAGAELERRSGMPVKLGN
ncbi:L,D-transpeptidase [Enterobacter cloacae complex sp. S4]|uniref:L,D-transpeptidase n=1 Tax=Enterobacter roggenkampii TaxID=1812935 RepID=A0AAX1WFB7_9ENTR|nr:MULTISPECIES: L,D-transpeptidase [Enterobacter cloacae complex]CAE6240426.1 putative L%2CD-transpeptidase ErfK/SrfK [Enterobacter cloacae]EHF8258652.1 L,D-transpeptidase [Enterobacter roggenkampii]ELD8603489.1 L,D-transpeptidase [Enterobacter roggenkampii]KTJ30944.1 L,D-transpeptidase [Enterobacter roggenkampii]MBE4869598.1 L,D-transpeptidase [Enterobacter cloacae complex sp. S4]